MKRRALDLETEAEASAPPAAIPTPEAHDASSRVKGVISTAARYESDLEARYVAARDAWTHAMRLASSGRSADMASLAIAQEAYETVMAERGRWLASSRIAVPIEAPDTRHPIEIAVGQELEWRRVNEPRKSPGFFGRIGRRLRGR